MLRGKKIPNWLDPFSERHHCPPVLEANAGHCAKPLAVEWQGAREKVSAEPETCLSGKATATISWLMVQFYF